MVSDFKGTIPTPKYSIGDLVEAKVSSLTVAFGLITAIKIFIDECDTNPEVSYFIDGHWSLESEIKQEYVRK